MDEKDKSDCEHENFNSSVMVDRLSDTGQFMASLRIECANCGIVMQFLGMDVGLDLGGAMVSVDGLEARLAIAPRGKFPNPIDRIKVKMGM